MKTLQLIKIVPLIMTMGTGFAQTAAERLEQGVQLQTADRDLDAAIKEYKAVLKSAARSHRLAAEARYRLAECFSEKGNHARMQEHLAALRADFPADNKWVRQSVKLAPVEHQFTAVPWHDDKIYHSVVKLPGGKEIGEFILAVRRLKDAPNETWETIAIRTAGGRSISRAEFTTKDYRSLEGRWYMEQMGDMSVSFQNGGKVTVFDSETKEEKGSYDHLAGESAQVPMFENEAMIQMTRALNQEIGTKQKTVVISALNGAVPVPFELEVTEHVDIETPAGTFPCAKVKTNLNQTFYIARSKEREIVRLEIGTFKVDLVKVEDWNADDTKSYQVELFGFRYAVPGTMIQSEEKSKENSYGAKFWASDFAGRDAVLNMKKIEELPESARESSRAYAEHIHAEVKKRGIFSELNTVEDSWETIEFDGKEAVAVRLVGEKGELTSYEYHVAFASPETPYALTFYIDYAKIDEERAIARANEIVRSFKF